MKTASWIQAHIHAYSYFEGVTRPLTPDTAKVAVVKNTRAELILNRSYQEMAEHYETAIVPARPVSPKDKASVEARSAFCQPGSWHPCAIISSFPFRN